MILFDLMQDVLGTEEGHAVTDGVHQHKTISPVHGLLQDASALSTLPRKERGHGDFVNNIKSLKTCLSEWKTGHHSSTWVCIN